LEVKLAKAESEVVAERKLFRKSVEEKMYDINRLKEQLFEVESSRENERAALTDLKKGVRRMPTSGNIAS
jgi:hypothetical protein